MIITELEKNDIIADMQGLLEEYNYNHTIDALGEIVDEWAEQKASLIEAFKKHPNYIEGKFMIAFAQDYSRGIDYSATYDFSRYMCRMAERYVDKVSESIKEFREQDGCGWLPAALYNILTGDYLYKYDRTINDKMVEEINRVLPEVHAHVGQKTSRVINKICCCLGYNQDPDYNREFAKFADALSPLTIKRHTILSLNPLDYLTMSFGNSWSSCHTIDKTNKRGMPNSYEGCYSSGTVSYMLDPSSMVFYTVDSSYDGNDYWTQPKINRQMYHYGEDKLVQGRLYPQDNDGAVSQYEQYRNIVQEIISTIFEFPNLWVLSKGTCAASRYIYSRGTHYTDYTHYENCTLSKRKDSPNDNRFTVGADPICVECGDRHSDAHIINCCNGIGECCAYCGRNITDDDDICWVDGEPYCDECATYCEECDEYCRNDDVTYIPSQEIYVCDYCREHYYTYCECCDEYVRNSHIRYIESEDIDVCEDCYNEYYAECSHCGKIHHIDSMRIVDYEYVCEDCYDEHYTSCSRCGTIKHIDDMCAIDDGNYVCEDCYKLTAKEEDSNN